jgi:hypothetical protein
MNNLIHPGYETTSGRYVGTAAFVREDLHTEAHSFSAQYDCLHVGTTIYGKAQHGLQDDA